MTNPISRFAHAFALPFGSFALIRQDPKLRRLATGAAITCLVLMALLIVGLIQLAPWLVSRAWAKPQDGWVSLWYVVNGLVFGLLFVAGASVVTPLGTSLFLDPISAATEKALGLPRMADGGGLASEVFRSLRKNLLRVAILLSGNLLLLVLWLIPGVGVLYLPLSIGWSSLGLAFEYVDVAGNRHGNAFRDTTRLLNGDRASTLGLGLALYAILWIPFLNCLMVPVGVVAATRFFHEGAGG